MSVSWIGRSERGASDAVRMRPPGMRAHDGIGVPTHARRLLAACRTAGVDSQKLDSTLLGGVAGRVNVEVHAQRQAKLRASLVQALVDGDSANA